MSTTNILDLNNRIDELEKNSGGGGSADSAKRSDIATEFSATTAYTAGCFVYHEGKLYQFNADHSAGAWDPTDVVEANVTDQIVSNKSAIDALGDMVVANPTGETTATLTAIEIDGVKYAIGGGGGGTVYLDNGKIGQADPASYITNCPLDTDLPLTGSVVLMITTRDGSTTATSFAEWTGSTIMVKVGDFDIYIYSDHVSLPNYGGSYRDIYCDIKSI